MPKQLHKLSVIVDVAHESADEAKAALNRDALFEPDNLDVSEVGDESSSVVVHDVTEPDGHGRRFLAQLCYTIVVEAESEDEAINAVDESVAFYADGWEVDQISVRPISSGPIS